MMGVRMKPGHLDRIRVHGEAAYPHECCGVLLGRFDGEDKLVEEIRELGNEREDSRHNRFLITPETLFRCEREARALQLDIIGFYHSHPNAPARPSEFDREHAWPTYSYVIVSVHDGRSEDLTSWVLVGDRSRFEAEPLTAAQEA
jgi:proteasome lid subunit RPN8/RPN11